MDMDAYLGEIRLVSFDYAPDNWLLCHGQLLPINEYQKLFGLLGTAYGGNGITTFGLPDLRSRVMVGVGQAPGAASYQRGQTGGAEYVLPTVAQLPAHVHPFVGDVLVATLAEAPLAEGGLPAQGAAKQFAKGPPNAAMSANVLSGQTSASGGGLPHANRQPLIALNYMIAIKSDIPTEA